MEIKGWFNEGKPMIDIYLEGTEDIIDVLVDTGFNGELMLTKEAFLHVTTHHPFRNRAFVLLPDHIHCLWTLPGGGFRFWSLAQQTITA
ncbi:MAG: Transposase [Candidatus Brocadiaceae bacterium]|nr:Transposase [Candidatus Brocadiaceae bacterium]MBM2835143.1 Transposase [Candidatus Brocadiaceae bacterium]